MLFWFLLLDLTDRSSATEPNNPILRSTVDAICLEIRFWFHLLGLERLKFSYSTRFLRDLAKKYDMLIVYPILERAINHGETIWDTPVIIGNHGDIISKRSKG